MIITAGQILKLTFTPTIVLKIYNQIQNYRYVAHRVDTEQLQKGWLIADF